jgi:hypothetical protein
MIKGWIWLLWVIVGLILEGVALVNGRRNGDTLTETIRRTLPPWLVFMGIGWLGWHFVATYLGQ